MSRTLFDKIWNRHVVADGAGARSLLYIDRHILHEGSFNGFEQLQRWGRTPRRPEATFATADHYAPISDARASVSRRPRIGISKAARASGSAPT